MDGVLTKIERLEKRLDEKSKKDEDTEFERLRREAKEEASKWEENVDTVHEKLLLLDNVARKTNHTMKEKISMAVTRFLYYKATPSFAANLVVKLLSTKAEEAVLVEEQKLIKCFGAAASNAYRHLLPSTRTVQALLKCQSTCRRLRTHMVRWCHLDRHQVSCNGTGDRSLQVRYFKVACNPQINGLLIRHFRVACNSPIMQDKRQVLTSVLARDLAHPRINNSNVTDATG